jgi:Mce-associated membrane protein
MNLFKKSSVDEIDVEEAAAEIEGQLSLQDVETDTDTEADAVAEAGTEAGEDQMELELGLPAEVVANDSAAATAPSRGKRMTKERRQGAGGPPIWVLAVATVLFGAMLAAFLVLRGGNDGRYTDKDVDDATRTAFNSAQDISTWDYRTIEGDVKHVLTETTGGFRTAYQQSAAKLLANAPAQEAVTTGTASKAGVESTGKDGIKVLVFLNQSTTKKGAVPSTDLHRLRLTMVKVKGQWLVSKLEVL